MWASALPSTALVLERNSAKIFPYRAKQSVFLGFRNQEELNQSYYGYVLLNKRKTNLYQYFTGGIQNIIIMNSMFWSLGLLRRKLEFFAGGGVMFSSLRVIIFNCIIDVHLWKMFLALWLDRNSQNLVLDFSSFSLPQTATQSMFHLTR